MDKELTALRRVAKAAKKYQEKVIQRRSNQLKNTSDTSESSGTLLDIGSAEFELSEALNDWYRSQMRAN